MNIFEGVDRWSLWNAAGPKLLQFIVIVLIIGIILSLAAKWIPVPKFLAGPIALIILLVIITLWFKTL